MKTFTFPHCQRLRKKGDVTAVISRGKKVYGTGHKAFILKNQLKYPRLCIIIAKKQIPSAVLRNKVKRLIRDSFRLTQLPAVDVIVIVYSKTLGISKQQFNSGLDQLWDISRHFFVT